MSRDNSLLVPATLLSVPDPSAVGEVRRFAQAAAAALGFDIPRAGDVAIVATELATNLVRHAKGGDVLVRRSQDGLDLLALDRGPGMRDVDRCLRDGFSTAGGPGNGLGAVRRLSDAFDIFSQPELGSAVLARFSASPRAAAPLEVGALSLPYPGEPACGDAWEVERTADRCRITVVDGLGHGGDAALAAGEALRSLGGARERGAARTLETLHAALRPTRGAAAAVAELDLSTRRIRYAGVGNIVAATASAASTRRMVSFDGIVGSESPKIQEFDYALGPGEALILHSDGLKSQWRLDRYPGLLARDPFLAAGVLYRDYFRGNDDVTVVVARAVEP